MTMRTKPGTNGKMARSYVMDLQRAKELASGLADGADPLTGEVLPDVRCRGQQKGNVRLFLTLGRQLVRASGAVG